MSSKSRIPVPVLKQAVNIKTNRNLFPKRPKSNMRRSVSTGNLVTKRRRILQTPATPKKEQTPATPKKEQISMPVPAIKQENPAVKIRSHENCFLPKSNLRRSISAENLHTERNRILQIAAAPKKERAAWDYGSCLEDVSNLMKESTNLTAEEEIECPSLLAHYQEYIAKIVKKDKLIEEYRGELAQVKSKNIELDTKLENTTRERDVAISHAFNVFRELSLLKVKLDGTNRRIDQIEEVLRRQTEQDVEL